MTQWRLVRSALFQLDTMEVLVSVIASGACEKYPDFNFVLGESGVTWLPYVFDRLDTEYEDRARAWASSSSRATTSAARASSRISRTSTWSRSCR